MGSTVILRLRPPDKPLADAQTSRRKEVSSTSMFGDSRSFPRGPSSLHNLVLENCAGSKRSDMAADNASHNVSFFPIQGPLPRLYMLYNPETSPQHKAETERVEYQRPAGGQTKDILSETHTSPAESAGTSDRLNQPLKNSKLTWSVFDFWRGSLAIVIDGPAVDGSEGRVSSRPVVEEMLGTLPEISAPVDVSGVLLDDEAQMPSATGDAGVRGLSAAGPASPAGNGSIVESQIVGHTPRISLTREDGHDATATPGVFVPLHVAKVCTGL
ncbi:hypothetical protein N7448_011132 [Penicillium atrosanguineum]|nr:hypothetical protein N7448_011132 [Penicillium atrosanguineum]